jgi:hypothetical protein
VSTGEAHISKSARTVKLVYAIARYFRSHPQACDTLDGVAGWWLTGALTAGPELEVALDILGNEGIVEAVHAADGRIRYRLASSADALARLDTLLARSDDGAGEHT